MNEGDRVKLKQNKPEAPEEEKMSEAEITGTITEIKDGKTTVEFDSGDEFEYDNSVMEDIFNQIGN